MKTSLHILNVEDNANDAELNEAMIGARWPHSEFIRVDTRTDLMDALETKNFDLILCDYSIPGFSGQEALNIANSKCPQTPFIFVSGTIGEDTAIEALKNGATDYVLKHRLMRLIPAVDRALREAAAQAERDHAEAAMRESEHKYREVFECLDEAAFLADEKTKKIIDTNRRAEEMLGCGRANTLGQKWPHFLKTGDGESERYEKPFDCSMICPAGRAMPVRVHTTKLTLYDRPLVLWLCRELSNSDSARMG